MPSKTAISLRLDSTVLEWFKQSHPKGYQTHINSLLRQHVNDQKEARARILGRAQEIFKHYYSSCFWHYGPDLNITSENLHLIVSGLKKYGGRAGWKLAEELSTLSPLSKQGLDKIAR